MKFDVLIAGGGPAGLSAAYAAAKAGASVAVFEKSSEIGYPIHTSGGSWIDELQRLQIPERFMHPITEGAFISANARAVFRYENAPICILDVRGLYQYLAGLAASAGAQIFVSSTVTEPIFVDDKVAGLRVRRFGRHTSYSAPLLIDATGASSLLVRKSGLSLGFKRVGVGAELDVIAPAWPQNRVAFLFGSEFAPSGYAWVFPHGDVRVRLGVGLIRPDTTGDPKTYLSKLAQENRIFGESLTVVSEIEYHAGIIPSEPYLERTASDGLLVVGDAGGLVSTLLGEGIRFAIDIGRMAGRVAAEAVEMNRFDRAFLRKFERNWQREYAAIFKIGYFVNQRLSKYSDTDWDRRVHDLASLDPDLIPVLLKGNLNSRNMLRILRANPSFFKRAAVRFIKSRF